MLQLTFVCCVFVLTVILIALNDSNTTEVESKAWRVTGRGEGGDVNLRGQPVTAVTISVCSRYS